MLFLIVFFCLFVFSFIFTSWRLITLQYWSGFCHTLTWISHGFTCISHPDPPSHLPLHLIPLGLPSAPGPSTCLMHPTFNWFLLEDSCFTGLLVSVVKQSEPAITPLFWISFPFRSPQSTGQRSPCYLCYLFYKLLFGYSVVSDSLWSHVLQPTRLLCPWDFPGKK